MNQRSETRQYAWLLPAAVFLFWFSVYTYPSFLNSYTVDTLGATKALAGVIAGSYGFVQMVLRIPLGIISDIIKRRKPFVMAGFAFSVAASAGLSLVAILAGREAVPPWLATAVLIFRGMSGVTAATWVNFSVLYSASYRGDEMAAAMSRVVLFQCGSQVLAMLLGAQLAGRLSVVSAFLLATVSGLAGLAVMAAVREVPPTGDPMTVRGFLEVARNRELISGTVLATVYQLVAWATVQGFVQNWARDVIGLTTAQLGYLSVANLLPNTIVSRFSGTVFSRKFGRRNVLMAGFALMALACFLYPLTRSLAALLAVQVLLGSGVGLIMPLTMASAIETVPNEKRGAAMGIYQAIYGLGMFLGPVIAGAVIERFSGGAGAAAPQLVRGYSANFYVSMGIAVAGMILALLLSRRAPGSAGSAEKD